MSSDTDHDDGEDGWTVSPSLRWSYTATAGFLIIITVIYGAWLWLILEGRDPPQELNWSVWFGGIMAIIWVFGPKTLAAWREFRGGN